jgi:F-type H+-transporting ATPase subunit a
VTLAFSNLLEHISDHPWPGWQVELWGMQVTLMSSAIATMLLVTLLLPAAMIPLARRWKTVPHGGANAIEVVVVFVRDMIARPALHGQASKFLPFLLTLFVYILALNLIGLVPLDYVAGLAGLHIGGTPTSVLTVCAGLAAATLLTIIVAGLRRTAAQWNDTRGWPLWASALASPLLWVVNLSPSIPGVAGAIMRVPISLLEFVGAVGKCVALVIRLFANMMSGHVLLGVLMLFVFQAAAAYMEYQAMHVWYVGPLVIAGSVLVSILELLVAGLQAYIFTFLAAMFLGLYVEAMH